MTRVLPKQLASPMRELNTITDPALRHKKLVDISETLLIYLVGILFGEYKKADSPIEEIEAEFYRYSSRKPSYGVWQSFLRMLAGHTNDSILKLILDKSARRQSVGQLKSNFEALRQVVNEGRDEDFEPSVQAIMKGRTVQPGHLVDYFDAMVVIRNIYAHPEDKAGKEVKRKWPLNNDYFEQINGSIEEALRDILDLLDLFDRYAPITIERIDNESKKTQLRRDLEEQEDALDLELDDEELTWVFSNFKYLLGPDKRVFIQHYTEIPSINPSVAQKIIEKTKAKERKPILLEMIREKLNDDQRIDQLELLILRDNARSSYISEDELFGLIEQVRQELNIEATSGSPTSLGTLFVQAKSGEDKRSHFNPEWIKYFSLIKRLDTKVVDKENKENAELLNQIKIAQKSLKSSPFTKKLEEIDANIKEIKAKRKEALMKLDTRIRDAKSKSKSAKTTEKKTLAREMVAALLIQREEKDAQYSLKLIENQAKRDELLQKAGEKFSEMQAQLNLLTEQQSAHYAQSVWGMHKNLWSDLNRYVDQLLSETLNSDSLNPDVEKQSDSDSETTAWVNNPNSWQQGNLSYTYWARIYPDKAPLGRLLHLGLAITNKFPWVPKNISKSLKTRMARPGLILWTSTNNLTMDRFQLTQFGDENGFNAKIARDYFRELSEMNVMVKVRPIDAQAEDFDKVDTLMPISEYYGILDTHFVVQIYSQYWTLPDLYPNGSVDYDVIFRMESELCALMQIFANAIRSANDFALTQGIDEQFFTVREQRHKELLAFLSKEFQTIRSSGQEVSLKNPEITKLSEVALKRFGCGSRLFKSLLYQFSAGRLTFDEKLDENVVPNE